MERELIEEIATMKGGQGRLEKIAEKLKTERAVVTERERVLNGLIELCIQLVTQLKKKPPVDSIGE